MTLKAVYGVADGLISERINLLNKVDCTRVIVASMVRKLIAGGSLSNALEENHREKRI